MARVNRRNSVHRMAGRSLPLLISIAALSLAGCGGGGGARPSPTPAPPAAPAPTPTPTPTPAPTPTPTPPPTGNFNTTETRRSDGVNFHGAITAYQAGGDRAGDFGGRHRRWDRSGQPRVCWTHLVLFCRCRRIARHQWRRHAWHQCRTDPARGEKRRGHDGHRVQCQFAGAARRPAGQLRDRGPGQ